MEAILYTKMLYTQNALNPFLDPIFIIVKIFFAKQKVYQDYTYSCTEQKRGPHTRRSQVCH